MKLQNLINEKLPILLFLTVVFSVSQIVRAAPGDVDLSFNAGTFDNLGSGRNIYKIKTQTDGKIIIGGSFDRINGFNRHSIARLNPDGSVDPSFSSPFIYTTSPSNVTDLIILPDGKILVNGSLKTPSGTKNIVRLNPDGTIDPTFLADPAVGGGVEFSLLPNNTIMVTNGSSNISILNANDGSVISHSTLLPSAYIRGQAVLSESQVLLANSENQYGVLRRYFMSTGIWDESSHVTVANDYIEDVKLQPNGSILISGRFTQVDNLPKSCVARLTGDGFVDTNFNTSIAFGYVYETNTQPDGKILLVGRIFFNGDSTSYATARLNPDGSLDNSFVRIPIGAEEFGTTSLQPDGKILIGGAFSNINGVPRQSIARLHNSAGPSNAPPVLSNVAVTTPISENGSAVLTGNISDADAGDSFTLTINWGDGSAPQTFNYPAGSTSFSETHQYLDDDPTGTNSDNYTISLTLSDGNLSDTASKTITVNNVAPALSNVAVNPATINVGGSTTLSGTITDVGTLDTHQIVINWGDGSGNTTLNLAAGVTSFNAAHQYNSSGTFNIAVTATDDDTGSTSGSASVTVNQPPPAVPNAPSNLTATVISANQINLAWTDNSNNESGFLVERCDGKGKCANFVQIAQTSANVTVFSNTGLTAATNYAYRIRAFNTAGNSAYSNTAKAKTLRR